MSTNSLIITFAGYPYTPSSLLPDNGMANLAASLLKHGHTTQILDLNTTSMIGRLVPEEFHKKMKSKIDNIVIKGNRGIQHVIPYLFLVKQLEKFQRREFHRIAEEVVRHIGAERVDFVGLKLWNGDGFVASQIIAEHIKKSFPDMPVFAGGPHVDIFLDTIYKVTDAFDCLAYGEGEETIVMLAEYVEGKRKLESISNIIFKKGGKPVVNPLERIEDLDSIPFPVYDSSIYTAMGGGEEKIKMLVIDESRGCPNKCSFCIHPVKSGQFRMKSPKVLVDEIEKFLKDEKISIFRFAGSSTPPHLLRKIAEEMIKRDLKVEYSSFGHVRGMDTETLQTLKKSGCFAIFYGMESGSQRILDSMNKNVKTQDVEDTIMQTKKADLFTIASIIFPAPFETEKTESETLDMLLKIRPDSVLVQMPGVYPQTEWANNPYDFNIELDREQYLLQLIDYKIKLFFPPKFWEPLPYKVNGKSFREFSAQTESMISQLEKNQLLTAVSDDMALLAKYSQMSPKQFRDENRILFLSGNEKAIREQVSRMNDRILSPS